jgi:allophanate hydrolase subunit 2
MDPGLAAVANRLVENPPGAPVLELALQGQRFEVLRDGWLALAGDSAEDRVNQGRAFRVRRGEILSFPPAPDGVWRYLAVPGGWAGRSLLGSCSGGTRLGEAFALRRGQGLGAVAVDSAGIPAAVARRTWAAPAASAAAAKPFPIWPGPQWEEFTADARERFFQTPWMLSSQCDRVGYRLQGDPIPAVPTPGISEPVLPGSIQVPPDGRPIVTMPDGPTLGGYPKIGWMEPAERARLAQCRAGQGIRFIPAS